jgi:hypothetical protein
MVLPCPWTASPLRNYRGRVRFRRRFHWPTRLADNERLWLHFAGVDTQATVYLGGRLLGSHHGPFEPFEWDITEQIQPRNELWVDVDFENSSDAPRGGIWADVELRVYRSCRLSESRLWTSMSPTPTLQAALSICSPSTSPPLTVRVLLDNDLLHEQTVAEPLSVMVALSAPGVVPWRAGPDPKLYTAILQLVEGSDLVDESRQLCGFVADDPTASYPVEELARPLEDQSFFEAASRAGRRFWVRLPQDVEEADRDRLTAACVARLTGFPCVRGICQGDRWSSAH